MNFATRIEGPMPAEEISSTSSSFATSVAATVNRSQNTDSTQVDNRSNVKNSDAYIASGPKTDLALYGRDGIQYGGAGQIKSSTETIEIDTQRHDYELETSRLDTKRIAYEIQAEQIYADRIQYETEVALMDSERIRQEEK